MINVGFEVEMNRAWVFPEDSDGEPIGETNFVIGLGFVSEIYRELYRNQYENLSDFLDWYEPELEGEEIYQRALSSGEIIEDLGVVMY